MTALEIILLLIGVICVAVSFIFFIKVDGPEKSQDINVKLSERQKEDIKTQISTVFREQASAMTQTVEDRTRDALEKLSNQKINELAEYSDTVLGEINKNHSEVMFLYDMLNEKNKEVHNNIRDLQNALKKNEEITRTDRNESIKEAQPVEIAGNEDENTASTVKEIQQSEAEEESVAEENANSKRDAVLKLHRQGKSEVEIAKTLGIGVGEVKLVIDLFKGMR